MTVSSLFQLKRSSVGKLMFFRRHRQMGDRQNHEDEGLQRNDQDVEKHGTFRIYCDHHGNRPAKSE